MTKDQNTPAQGKRPWPDTTDYQELRAELTGNITLFSHHRAALLRLVDAKIESDALNQSAPVFKAAQNSAESDPAVTPGWAGAGALSGQRTDLVKRLWTLVRHGRDQGMKMNDVEDAAREIERLTSVPSPGASASEVEDILRQVSGTWWGQSAEPDLSLYETLANAIVAKFDLYPRPSTEST